MKYRKNKNGLLVYSTGPRPVDLDEERARAEKAPEPTGPGVAVLRMEKKGRGGKTVTVVELRNVPGDDIPDLAKALKNACGVGGTLKDTTIELQGDQRERVRPVLDKHGMRVKG